MRIPILPRLFLSVVIFLSMIPASKTASLNKHVVSLKKTKTAMEASLRESIAEKQKLQKIQQEIETRLTPDKRMMMFVKAFKQAGKKHGFEKLIDDLSKSKGLQKSMSNGSVTGNLTIPTNYISGGISVLAFDTYGYFVKAGTTSYWDKTYAIDGLSSGDYYIMAVSSSNQYLDEIYDNIPAPYAVRSGWRNAQKVTVTDSTTTENINFDLVPSVEIYVHAVQTDGVTRINADEGFLTITANEQPGILTYEEHDLWTQGQFARVYIPQAGDYKIGINIEEDDPVVWYPNTKDWNSAEKITVPTYPDTIDTVRIVMQSQGNSTSDVGKISGNITGNGMLSLIFAFNTSDLSLAGMGITFYSSYTIEDLPAGEYYVFAEDYLGNVEGRECLLGTFYPNAPTVQTAEKVNVTANTTTTGINIQLRQGAAIEGVVKDDSGNPLGQMLLVALDLNMPDATIYNLFTQFHFNLAQTDTLGKYRIAGLQKGSYIVRTLSEYAMDKFWGLPITVEGPHKGQLVDVFYPDLPNLFDFEQAQRIAVQDTQTVTGIDFTLEKAKHFKGKMSTSDTGEMIDELLMVAIIDSSDKPYMAIPQKLGNGNYSLGPFPSGQYKLYASPNHEKKDFYLPEYYNDAKTYDQAQVLQLVDSDLENIDFVFDMGGMIQGHIDLQPNGSNYPAGADTSYNFPVVCFNADNGAFVKSAYVQFSGGYRIPQLAKGNYKIVALPMSGHFSGTYFGGGNHFNDPVSQIVNVDAGNQYTADIELETASGSIKGTVTDLNNGMPVNNCLVIAYDQSGHAIGLGITDEENAITGAEGTGQYQIRGLRPQDYWLRTCSIVDEVGLANAVPAMFLDNEDPDLLEMAFSLLDILFATDMSIYADAWYKQVHFETTLDIPELTMSFITGGMGNEYDNARYPFYLPIPFFDEIHNDAESVQVTNGGAVTNINFMLRPADMKDIILDVDPKSENEIADQFILYSNYPNPFNPKTVIGYQLPIASFVTLDVYDIQGRWIKTLVNGEKSPGLYHAVWDGTNHLSQSVSSGVYVYHLRTAHHALHRKMILLR